LTSSQERASSGPTAGAATWGTSGRDEVVGVVGEVSIEVAVMRAYPFSVRCSELRCDRCAGAPVLGGQVLPGGTVTGAGPAGTIASRGSGRCVPRTGDREVGEPVRARWINALGRCGDSTVTQITPGRHPPCPGTGPGSRSARVREQERGPGSGAARGAGGRGRGPGVLGPGVPGVAAAHLGPHLGVGAGPEGRQVIRHGKRAPAW